MADQNEFAVGATMTGHYGAETTGVTLAETAFAAAWNVQGDARRLEFIERVNELFAVLLPITPNTTARNESRTALWLGPTSWLVIESNVSNPTAFESRRDALNAVGGALFAVSASGVAWTVAGTHAATILAKACPLDFHPRAFTEGACAQSVFGRVSALFYRRARARCSR